MDQAFDILGIEPTTDRRAIRAAFLRLARIYHPDRFAGMPDEVRVEAERRMKDATVAYESLRRRRDEDPADDAGPPISTEDLQESARRYKEVIAAKEADDKRNRARWRRWEKIEMDARMRAEFDAQIAAAIAKDADDWERHVKPAARPAREPSEAPADEKHPGKAGSSFEKRLAAARDGESAAPLAKRPD